MNTSEVGGNSFAASFWVAVVFLGGFVVGVTGIILSSVAIAVLGLLILFGSAALYYSLLS